jgi:hypothetical protein
MLEKIKKLEANSQFCDYSEELKMDLSDISYIDNIPTIKDKPFVWVDDLETLEK